LIVCKFHAIYNARKLQIKVFLYYYDSEDVRLAGK